MHVCVYTTHAIPNKSRLGEGLGAFLTRGNSHPLSCRTSKIVSRTTYFSSAAARRSSAGRSSSHETLWKFLKKLKMKLPYDSVTSLLVVYLKKQKMLIQKDIYMCPCAHCSAIYVTARPWKQPECLSTDEQTKKLWYTHTTERVLPDQNQELNLS